MSEEHLAKANELIQTHKFLMLSKSWCPDCHRADKILQDYGVFEKVHVVEFDTMKDQVEAVALENAFISIVGRKWVPTFFFNGEVCKEELVDLEKAGKTEEVFKQVGLL